MAVKITDRNKDLGNRVWFEILKWGNENMRLYPWRNNPTPYNVLIAEVMLHRTRADQVNKLYPFFVEKYSDFKAISDADIASIREDLASLGLKWRADLLYSMAKTIQQKYGGVIPKDKYKLMKLPGVGKYIASAVLCFGYDKKEPILDTNTVRVISRIFDIEATDSSRRSKKFENIFLDLVSLGEPRKFSLSLIDFAALICTARTKPRHDLCPLRDFCAAYNQNKIL